MIDSSLRRLRHAARPIVAIDTATAVAVVALGDLSGRLLRADAWPAGHRHGEELLARLGRLLDVAGTPPSGLAAIVVGTGPGAFTGLRVGLATAKTLAHELDRPIVGVSTGRALLAAAEMAAGPRSRALLLPAGPSDLTLVGPGDAAPRLVAGGEELGLAAGLEVVAVDLEGRAPAAALALGARARDGLAAALVRLGAARLARGEGDDVAALVPEYVTLPRGVRTGAGEMAWSHGRR